MADDRWLRVGEAAERLQLSEDSVRRRADAGEIVSRWTKPPRGGQREYLERSVEEYARRMAAGEASDT